MAKNIPVVSSGKKDRANSSAARVSEPIVQDGKIVVDSGDQDAGVRI